MTGRLHDLLAPATGPRRLLALHHHGVHDRSAPSASRSPGPSPRTTRTAAPRSTSPPASATRRRPTTPSATRASRCSSRTRPAPGMERRRPGRSWSRGSPRWTTSNLAANRERYWRESNVKLPATKKMHPPKPMRAMIGWYYTRIYVLVRPERVFVWPGPDVDRGARDPRLPPRGGPLGPRRGAGRRPRRADRRPGRLGRAGRRARPRLRDGRGHLAGARRLPALGPPADPRRRRGQGDPPRAPSPAGLPLIEGRACLTVHRHAPDFTWQNNFQVRGDLGARPGRLAPRPAQARRRLRGARRASSAATGSS